TGLWHGASWNFVLWGLYYGVLVILEKLFLGKLLAKLPRILQHLYLLFAVVLGWSLFYYTDLSRLGAFLPALFGLAGAGLWDVQLEVVLVNNLYWLILALVGCLPILPMCKKRWEGWEKPALVRRGFSAVQMLVSLALLAVCTAFLAGQSYNPFLYFRF
ncbi:MAG: MBOAT family protein, partial [Oscillospiraceae bacterium]|nr:MBOAT family protein [Oscillospiraceae bacterium]